MIDRKQQVQMHRLDHERICKIWYKKKKTNGRSVSGYDRQLQENIYIKAFSLSHMYNNTNNIYSYFELSLPNLAGFR